MDVDETADGNEIETGLVFGDEDDEGESDDIDDKSRIAWMA